MNEPKDVENNLEQFTHEMQRINDYVRKNNLEVDRVKVYTEHPEGEGYSPVSAIDTLMGDGFYGETYFSDPENSDYDGSHIDYNPPIDSPLGEPPIEVVVNMSPLGNISAEDITVAEGWAEDLIADLAEEYDSVQTKFQRKNVVDLFE